MFNYCGISIFIDPVFGTACFITVGLPFFTPTSLPFFDVVAIDVV